MNEPDHRAGGSHEGDTRSELSGSARDVVQAGDVHGGVHFHGQREGSGPLPRQLPAGIRGFVDRLHELDLLDRVLAADAGEPPAVGLSVITGTAGVGKTSLALHWAHRVRDRFPGGQLYANLRGYDPGPPVTAEQVLDRFLRTLNVRPGAIPVDLDARAALYRSLLADRRMLVVLDNAATVGQVRPLLPGTAGSLVVVTSRSRMSGLVVRDGAHRVTVDVLTESESVSLFRTVADSRVDDDPEKLAELVRLCARLPLALRIAAERAARHPWLPIDQLIRDLRDESGLWDALSADNGDEADAVRTVFAWSYRSLPEFAARVFRLLGLHPGAEFSAGASAALTGVDTAQARQLLDILVGASLLEQRMPDRYQFHDLLRVYATDQARREETPETRQTVLRRVLTWYLHTADAVQAVMDPFEPRVSLEPLEPGVTPMTFTDYDDAKRWFEAEQANLRAATRAAVDADFPRIAWQLAVVLRSVYMIQSPLDDWLATTRIGLDAARREGDRGAEAELLESLAIACAHAHRFAQSIENYRGALAIRRELGGGLGEVLTLNGLGLVHMRRHDLRAARTLLQEALANARELGDAYWTALMTGNVGKVRCELEEYAEALRLLRDALEVFQEQGAHESEADVHRAISAAHRGQGEPDLALQSIQRALVIAREHDHRVQEAYFLLELGSVQRAGGQPAEALVSYQRAAVMHRQLGDRSREAQAIDGAGEAYRELGRFDEAADFHRHAGTIHGDLEDHWRLAVALDNLASALDRVGDSTQARQHRVAALSALESFDDPKAIRLRRRISTALDTG
jgi:tetratricopeptide (TPR) repeat protein